MKLTGKASLMDIAGILTKKEAEMLKKHITERQEESRKIMEEKIKRLVK